ncbi:zinc finger CCCH domain-containing protein 32-like [Curcuma longa]|uniref:zinc finger CCCH domain-containing protein 32-like n=1 Tax=Curcuma longa TaxID=136217 RepID=UPI003D9F0A3E
MESDGGGEAIRPSTPAEEALKRNTDCVYFLASPLTCKKGSECDYRHNEGARVNPRDCWYWLNGNCLNPKCSFRHPPLDSIFGIPTPNSTQPPTSSQTAVSASIQATRVPNNSNKQSVPCYYFQRGQCLKGERCPFMHGPQASVDFVSQHAAKASTFSAEPQQRNEKDTQKKITKRQMVAEANLDYPKVVANEHVGVSSATPKFVPKAENVSNYELSENKILLPSLGNEPPLALPQNGVVVNNSYLQSQPWDRQVQPIDDEPDNDRDYDEVLREHSPGFDVLVDDDVEDPDYYHSEDNFRRLSAHGGQNMEVEDEYGYHHSDYETMGKFETDQRNDIDQYENYEQPHSRYDLEPKTSRRLLERSPSLEKRVLDRERKPNAMDGSDLRNQLMKRRRFNDSRSTGNHDGHSEHYRKDEHYAKERHYGRPARNNEKLPSEKSISSRLQGRIVFPGRSSSDPASNLLLEKEKGRRPRSRLSPVRRIDYQTRNPERAWSQPSEELNKDERIHRNKITPRDGTNSLDFASPKSLSELKGTKINKNIHDLSTTSSNVTVNTVESIKVEGVHESENPLSFEGPMPLSAILQRKRKLANVEDRFSAGHHENNQSGGDSAVTESVPPLEAKEECNFTISSQEAGVIPSEDELAYNDAIDTEDGISVENEEEELENYDKQDGDFHYESGEYKVDDENTIHFDEDDQDDDDDDDFARKISVILS